MLTSLFLWRRVVSDPVGMGNFSARLPKRISYTVSIFFFAKREKFRWCGEEKVEGGTREDVWVAGID